MTAPDDWAVAFEPLWWSSFAARSVALDDALGAPDVDLVGALQGVSLDAWGAILLDPPRYLPRNGHRLPTMPSPEDQLMWTGAHGATLLRQSLAFVRSMLVLAPYTTGTPVLDFGFGWGRLSRLMLKYVPKHQLHGADPMQSSIDVARACGLKHPMHLVSSRMEASEIPGPFGLIYAFSVFTHLAPDAFTHALDALRERLLPGGRLVLTTRSAEFWRVSAHGNEGRESQTIKDGIAYIEQSPDYGDTAVTDEWLIGQLLRRGFTDIAVDWNHCDPHQYVWAASLPE